MKHQHRITATVGLLASAFLLPLFLGCEETLSGTEFSLPYKRELIVQGFLTADSTTQTLLITRTLPPLEEWTAEKSAVTDAVGTVSSDGIDYPLVHTGKGRYEITGLRPRPGNRYTLDVEWSGLHVTGTATIPPTPELVGVYIDTVAGGCNFQSETGEVYQADEVRIVVEYRQHGANMNSAGVDVSYSYDDTIYYREEGYDSFFYNIDSSGNTHKGIVSSRCYARDNPILFRIDTLFLDFVEYEADFSSFYDTRWDGAGDNIFFGPSGEHPDWNITGDGFGWFFGRSTLKDTAVLK